MAYKSTMELDINNTGSQTIRYTFEDISFLRLDEKRSSPRFYLCNTAWELWLERTDDDGQHYLSIYLEKADDEYEVRFSYHVEMAITILSYEGSKNITEKLEGRSANSRFMFGKRDGESMCWGFPTLILWNKLLNPRNGFLTRDDDTIEVELSMKLVKIWPHKDDCVCGHC